MAYVKETALRDARAFDEGETDAAWERTTEQALRAFRAGDSAKAKTGWARAFEIADGHFKRGDPRLAASCTNQAFSLIRQQLLHQANKLFDDAIICWEDSWRWVPLMVPPCMGEQAEDAQYSADAQKDFYLLVQRGQSITETMAKERNPADDGLRDWKLLKPKLMCDERKLLSAVSLIVSRKP